MKKTLFIFLALWSCLCVHAEDGSRLWLRYDSVGTAQVECNVKDATTEIAVSELTRYCRIPKVILKVNNDADMPEEGFKVGYAVGSSTVFIYAKTSVGALYGAYALLRQQSVNGVEGATKLQRWEDAPSLPLRILNHWDNLDGSIERGYAGKSIFWNENTQSLAPIDYQRLRQYARANASIGINGTVLNNVNASPKMLSPKILKKVKAYADFLRPYGIRVYLSVNFASPMKLSGLKTADPLDPQVRAWWKKKVKEVYGLIPDFGGFLVKANSEGQPGPGDYKRTHADGANMLAEAIKPYGGIIMWRSFVYGNHQGEDRVKQAVSEFQAVDGEFMDNVILQSKNGPLDFQPREPYAPFFDAMPRSSLMAELQITQEYLGQSKHLVYLAPMWSEFFGYVDYRKLKGIAGVANIGDDRNWCGHHFSQANWYAFGRMAWNPKEATPERVAEEWIRLTFVNGSEKGQALQGTGEDVEKMVGDIKNMMLTSREACVDYMMPLGLHHIFAFDHHYGPEPDGFKAEYPIEWCPVYYHKADKDGIGFDRSSKGTDAVSQYREPYRSIYDRVETCPEEFLLWFHHVDWNYRLRNGLTLMDNLRMHYDRGVQQVEQYKKTWTALAPYIDKQRWQEVDERLDTQCENAHLWRKTCMDYFEKVRSAK